MVGSTKARLISFALCSLVMLLSARALPAQSQPLDELSLERWAKLREVERHQLKIAEKYFREKSWSVAADEYDKYMTLYETSDAASHALLKWSLCQVEMRRQNTAIDDGFRSVVDYWPDSPDAIAAAYYIGRTYKDIGQIPKAKTALKQVVDDHAKHLAGVYAMVNLADIARIENDDDSKIEIWQKLTFDASRDKRTQQHCIQASLQLASYQFDKENIDEAIKALATTYQDSRLYSEIVSRSRACLQRLAGKSETKSNADRAADQIVSFLRDQEPDDISDDEGKATARRIGYLIADVQQNASRDEQVLKAFGEISRRFGNDDELLGKTGGWFKSKGNYEKARVAYRAFEDKPAGLSQVAISYREEKNLDQAVATYRQLTSVDAANAVKWKAESAATYRQFSKHPEAIAIYQELMTEDAANTAKWLWEIATAYRDSSKWKEAIGFFRQSDRFPDNYREMANCHRRLKQYDEAVILYNQIAGGHKPSAPWAMLQIGYTEEEASKEEKAIAAFKRVCRLFPKDQYASRAHAHLQNKYKLSVTLGGAKDE